MIGASAATSTDGEFGGEQEHPDLGDRANCSTMSSSGQRKTLSLTSLLLLTSILSTLLIQLNAFLSAAAKVAVLGIRGSKYGYFNSFLITGHRQCRPRLAP
jgi:hypothetical protein